MHDLTAYQSEIARAVLDDVVHRRAGLFTLEMAAGPGSQELSAQLRLLLLTLHIHDGGRLLTVAPAAAGDGQERLAAYLRERSLHGLWSARPGVVRLGRAEWRAVTPEQVDRLTGPTARPVSLIEVLEAEALSQDEYERLFRLARSAGATLVLHGFPWHERMALEETNQCVRESEATGGPRRHFRMAWERAAIELPEHREPVVQGAWSAQRALPGVGRADEELQALERRWDMLEPALAS